MLFKIGQKREKMSEVTFDKLMGKINRLWAIQKKKSSTADRLLDECEKIETEMVGYLKDAEKLDPAAYVRFLKTFERIDTDEKMDSV